MRVLVLNSGSSSVKFRLLDPEDPAYLVNGIIERIGESGSRIRVFFDDEEIEHVTDIPDHKAGVIAAFALLSESGHDPRHSNIVTVGHRVVMGGDLFTKPVVVTDKVLDAIRELSYLAPLHNPANADGIAAVRIALPDIPQVAVFDTAFFADLPEPSRTYAIDREVATRYGVRRYGFHGTSHDYVSHRVAEFLDRPYESLRQIVLHLGNGASASAIAEGRAVDTSMGMTPMQGLVMGTRSGDIDPGVMTYLSRAAEMDATDLDHLLNRKSGLRGLCGHNDFRELTDLVEAGDPDAVLAYEVYLHRLRMYIGGYLMLLGGADTITFTAGVGENAPKMRADALSGLEWFGIEIDPERNALRSKQPRIISTDSSRVTVLVVPTDEELLIARAALSVTQ
ncbi:acetate kinase [Millisia brevis]|uniref:acetate kinase n=1 Tax=Millisia brevis TaxID=264148 RepID=UPI000829D0BF|nr:acetate kinase [Millisia brevis]